MIYSVKKITKEQFMAGLAFAVFSTSIFAVETKVSVTPESYHYVSTEQNFNTKAHYRVEICNPTNAAISGSYSASLSAQGSSKHSDTAETVTVPSKECFIKEFDMYFPVTYYQNGSYRLTGGVTAHGVEDAYAENYGWIGVGMY